MMPTRRRMVVVFARGVRPHQGKGLPVGHLQVEAVHRGQVPRSAGSGRGPDGQVSLGGEGIQSSPDPRVIWMALLFPLS